MTPAQQWMQLLVSCLLSLAANWHASALQGVSVPGMASEANAQRPSEPGCYVQMPNGCPKNPQFEATTWKHDRAGESTMRATRNRTVCEVVRRSNFMKWCGVDDANVKMLFVQEAAEEPTEPGCYVRAPTECPRQPTFEPNYWKRDKQGEDTTDAGFNEGTCMDRKEKFNKWCGVIDMEMRFIPGQTGWGTSADGSSDAPNTAEAQAAQARARELRRADPAFPGCYVQAPTSCPKQDAFAVGDWKRDKYGEMNKEAGTSEEACQRRKGSFDTWCGVTDTIMRFIPPGAERSVDNSPGCYVMLPSQCPKQPTFIVGRWKRDKYGESNKDALLREDACMARKSGFDSYCGTTNAIMRFVPGPNSILSSDESVNTGADPTGGFPTGAEFPQDYSNPMGQPYGMPGGMQPYGMPLAVQPSGMQPYGMQPYGMQPYGLPAGAPPMAGASGLGGVDDGSNAPGCYVMMPKSCPKQPGFLAGTWKKDKYGEENKDAKTDPAACQARKSSFDRFCGTDDAIMKFVPPGGLPQQGGFDGGMVPGMPGMPSMPGMPGVPLPGGQLVPPQQLRPLDPALPGCYVQAPTACPKQPDSLLVGHWKRDTYGEAKIGAGGSESACMSRKASFDMWCGVRDVLMRYIPLGAEIGLDTSPGCYILVPSTCPKQPTFSIGRWKRDKFGESNKEAGIKEDACIERKQSFDAFCGITNTIARFVPGPDAILSTQAPVPAPGSGDGASNDGPPGCYVKAVSTCPKQDAYKINEWKRDNFGEEHKGAAASQEACNARKASFDEWCGVSDMVMKFTPFAGADDTPGCYVLLPVSCPKQSKFQIAQWKRDKFGEDNRKAGIEEDACRARKASFDSFCGVKNAIMRFVPGPGAIMSTRKDSGEESHDESGSSAGAAAAPAKSEEEEKGCFVKVTACPKQPTFQVNTWKRDKFGEEHGGKTDEAACQKRKASFDKYCGVDDAEMRFVGPDGKIGSGSSSGASAAAAAIQPGCYVKAPTSCPAHPTFKTGVWKRDVHGERNQKAGISLDACNSRKASFDKFCGVDNMQMRFVPADGSSGGEDGSSGDQTLSNQVREDPAESPGCYYIAPSWCPKNRAFVAGTWYRDAHVAVSANVTLGEEMCNARVDIYNKMCGVVDVRTRFVPPRPVRPTSFPEDNSRASTELPPEPTKPGCYVAAPTDCPSDASFSVRKWKHDTYGETMRDAAANRTACEQRKWIFDNFCGVTDMVMRFVPRSDEMPVIPVLKTLAREEPMPEEPGCHVKAPTACPLEEEFPVGVWKHDTYGEAMTRAAFDRSTCENDRKDFFVRWCGAPDIATYFVPAADPNDPSQASDADEELPPAVLPPERTRTGVMPSPPTEPAAPERRLQEEPASRTPGIAPHSAAAQPDAAAPQKGAAGADGALEPGCYIRAPTKCPLRPSFTVGEWKHDAWAEENMNALVDRVACHRRKANFESWCGIEDIEVRHIGSMEEQAPREPGCYIFAPDGCPRQPFFRVATWVHDKYGEVMQRAGSSKTVCEQERRRVFAKWCGSDDLKMKFVPNTA